MYVIKMNSDKSLENTINATIYQYEKNADTLVFLVPKFYEENNLADCSMMLRYILPDGTGKSEELFMEPEPYKNYYRYHLDVNTKITSQPGKIELWLSAINFNDILVLKSGTAYIEVTPRKNIVDCFCDEDLEQLERLEAKVKELEDSKADDIILNTDSTIQLTANGQPIGQKISITTSGSIGVANAEINDEGELIITFDDGSTSNLGKLGSEGGIVYVPHISDRKILSFTIEDMAGEIPDPVDLNPHDEWSSVDDTEIATDYIWESL